MAEMFLHCSLALGVKNGGCQFGLPLKEAKKISFPATWVKPCHKKGFGVRAVTALEFSCGCWGGSSEGIKTMGFSLHR